MESKHGLWGLTTLSECCSRLQLCCRWRAIYVNLGSRLKAQCLRLKAQSSRLKARGAKLGAQSSGRKARGSKLGAQSSKFQAQSSRLKAWGSNLEAQCSKFQAQSPVLKARVWRPRGLWFKILCRPWPLLQKYKLEVSQFCRTWTV